MKHFIFSVFVISAISSAAFAREEGPCVNYAKSSAIRAYKAETGTIQGSDGIDYSAKLVATKGAVYDYVVSISDNNEDGDTWTVDYTVRVKKSGSSCKVLSVEQVDAN